MITLSFSLSLPRLQGEFTMEEVQVYKDVFAVIDEDGSGAISTAELKRFVK